MSIMKTLYTGVAGLQAHGRALGVVGDNIANVNTAGYKAERAIFSDLLGRSVMATNSSGSGAQMTKITREFSQGTLLTTDSPTDLAINGKGFFIVNGTKGSISGNYYSRAGQFALNNEGNLVNPDGMVVQGYLANTLGQIDNQLTDLTIANSVLPPRLSSAIDISANVDSTQEVPTLAWDTANPGTTSNFSTAITVYDSLGAAHRVDVYFRKTAENEWDWHALVDGGELTGGTAGVAQETAAGHLQFTSDGFLNQETTTTAPDFDFIGATQDQAITFDFGESIAEGGTGQTGVTQYAAASNIRSQEQDGYGTGELLGVGVEGNGSVMAVFSNGEQRLVGQVALATFEAEGDLARAGSNLWMETRGSGNARISGASTGSAGSITAGAIEQSTVDLAGEFVNLIAYQRGFQANSRTISTADQLYQEIVNLKR